MSYFTNKELREFLQLRQKDMARLLGIKRGTYSAIECGHRKPTGDSKYRLDVLHSLVDEIIKVYDKLYMAGFLVLSLFIGLLIYFWSK